MDLTRLFGGEKKAIGRLRRGVDITKREDPGAGHPGVVRAEESRRGRGK
jgi:hypothetical protein